MTTALVLGDPGSGLTTFIGLLYTAQVRYGIEASDEFRFHAERESIIPLGRIYGALGDGRFPTDEADLEEHPLEFSLGFRHGRLPWATPSGPEPDPAFDVVRLRVGAMTGDEVVAIYQRDPVLTRASQELLFSPVVIPLVDVSRFPPTGAPTPDQLERFDRTLAATFELLDRAVGTERKRRARRMFPLFVATKLDQVPPEALRRLGARSLVIEEWSPEDRAAIGRQILVRYLPKTRQFLEDPKGHRAELAPATWYFSYLETVAHEDGGRRIQRRMRSPEGGWEPAYPYGEYRSLLTRLGELAHELPHPALAA